MSWDVIPGPNLQSCKEYARRAKFLAIPSKMRYGIPEKESKVCSGTPLIDNGILFSSKDRDRFYLKRARAILKNRQRPKLSFLAKACCMSEKRYSDMPQILFV